MMCVSTHGTTLALSFALVLPLSVAFGAAPASAQGDASEPVVRVVSIDGHAVRVQVSGLARREPGRPLVVFEAGATQSLETWRSVVPRVAAMAPMVAYDRAGLGESAWDGRTPTPEHVVARLRSVLAEIGAGPPYVLVGHSWGGSLIRFFAGYHPEDVVGIVYVDPGPIITQSVADEVAPFEAIGAGRAGYDAAWAAYAALVERGPPAVRAEFEVYRGLTELEVGDRGLGPVPDVPIVVILAAKPYPALPGLPFDSDRHFLADLDHRIRMLREWALSSTYGTVVVTNHTTHAVPREDPDVIVWAVERVLSTAAGKE